MTGSADDGYNLARYVIGRAASKTPDKPALIVFESMSADQPSEVWTYAELETAVLRVAAGLLAAGLSRGDRVLIRLDNTSSYPILFFGAIAAGLMAVPASSEITSSEADFLAADSGASLIAIADTLAAGSATAAACSIDETGVAALIAGPERVDYATMCRDDPAYLIYTSGTTARPKGVIHAHRVAEGRSPTYQGWYAMTSADRMLHAGAFNWTYTLGTGLIDPWANGATSVIYTGTKSPDVWPKLIVKSGATLFAAVPSLIRRILKYAPPGRISLGRLRHVLIAGEAPPQELFDEWLARTGLELYEALGMSEISTFISTSPTVPRKANRAGKPQAGRRIAILQTDAVSTIAPPMQEGLIAVHRSDPGLMLGYWNRADEAADVFRGEWFIGGDLGFIDDEGYVAHTGRANDIMKALGYRVSPQEIEAVLALCPGIAEVACAEIRVRSDVSVIGAFVVRHADGRDLDAAAIQKFAADRLATYKCPREIIFVAGLPRTPNGKIQRRGLAALHIPQ